MQNNNKRNMLAANLMSCKMNVRDKTTGAGTTSVL